MSKITTPATRLWVLLARKARVAVILRRGPTRYVQLITWNLEADTFVPGQWFKGRIYERRCDLSPSGELLIYFAASYRQPLYSWTAVSKPPWFSALALWPKGDGWNGGGYFTGPYSIHLDHFSNEAAPHPQFVENCRKLRIESFAPYRGEDSVVWHAMLKRDGWTFIGGGDYRPGSGFFMKATVPETWKKEHRKFAIQLQMSIEGLHKRNGAWYVTRYRVVSRSGEEMLDLGLTDWAEWDANGDLLFARTGKIFRHTIEAGRPAAVAELANFSENTFQAIEAPDWAKSF